MKSPETVYVSGFYHVRNVEQKRAGRWSGKALAVAFALEFSPLKIVQRIQVQQRLQPIFLLSYAPTMF
jgi:hypothetical protein